MLKALNYRTTLFLLAAIALIDLTIFLYVAPFNFEASHSLLIRVGFDFGILFGIWVTSIVARYLGALWFLFSAASIFWPLATPSKIIVSVPLVLFLIVGATNLVTATILIFSPTFSEDFSRERKTQQEYKKTLRRIATVIIVVAMVIGTLVDIYRLTQFR